MTTTHEKPCAYCESELGLEAKLVTVHRRWQGQYFIFENVPALVCRHCGNRYFEVAEVERMEAYLLDPHSQDLAVPVPVVRLAS
jgi:YgiT-type zinc finger domain-containing protein